MANNSAVDNFVNDPVEVDVPEKKVDYEYVEPPAAKVDYEYVEPGAVPPVAPGAVMPPGAVNPYGAAPVPGAINPAIAQVPVNPALAAGVNPYITPPPGAPTGPMPGQVPGAVPQGPPGPPPGPQTPMQIAGQQGWLPPQMANPTAYNPLSPQGAAKERAALIDIRKAALGAEAENQAVGQDQIATIHAGAAAEQQKLREQQLAWQQQAKVDVDRKDAELRSLVRDAMNKKIDPDHYWNSKDTGGKITSVIGMMLGGIGGGLNKTHTNPALDMLNRAIERDMQAQKGNIENNWKQIDKLHGLNNDAFTRSMHLDTWQTNHRIAGLEVVKLQLQEAAAKTNNVSVKNNAIDSIAKIDQEQIMQREKLYAMAAASAGANQARLDKLAGERRESSGKRYDALLQSGMSPGDALAEANRKADQDFPMLKNTMYASPTQIQEGRNQAAALQVAAKMVEESGGRLSLDAAYKVASRDISKANPIYGSGDGPMSKNDKEKLISFNGQDVIAPSKEVANKYREESQPFSAMVGNINRLKEINAKPEGTGGTLSYNQLDEVNRINALLGTQLGQMNKAGTMQEAEVKRMGQMIPDVGKWGLPGRDINARLDALGSTLNMNQQARFKAYGSGNIEGYKPGVAATPAVPAQQQSWNPSQNPALPAAMRQTPPAGQAPGQAPAQAPARQYPASWKQVK